MPRKARENTFKIIIEFTTLQCDTPYLLQEHQRSDFENDVENSVEAIDQNVNVVHVGNNVASCDNNAVIPRPLPSDDHFTDDTVETFELK